jgi:hypothetical protein
MDAVWNTNIAGMDNRAALTFAASSLRFNVIQDDFFFEDTVALVTSDRWLSWAPRRSSLAMMLALQSYIRQLCFSIRSAVFSKILQASNRARAHSCSSVSSASSRHSRANARYFAGVITLPLCPKSNINYSFINVRPLYDAPATTAMIGMPVGSRRFHVLSI